MPKFNEQEKQLIQEKLIEAGETLFKQYGVKKVSVNDIVKRVGIAHGSFYNFYESKEHLFTDISWRIRERVFQELEELLKDNKNELLEDKVKIAIQYIMRVYRNNQVFFGQDMETVEYLRRKVQKEILHSYIKRETGIVDLFEKYGVRFSCKREIIKNIIQLSFVCGCILEMKDRENAEETMQVIVSALTDKIIEH